MMMDKKQASSRRAARGGWRSALGLLAAALILPAVLSGCGTARRGVAATGRELTIGDPQAQRGQLVFMHTCQACHPGGERGLGPALNDKPLPGFLIRMQVRLGLGAMPSFSKDRISRDDLGAIVAYLKTLRRSGR